MKTLINYPVKVFVTGFVALIFLSLLLFWIRFACESSITENIPEDASIVEIKPTGIMPRELEYDPNIDTHSRVYARLKSYPFYYLGIIDYFESKLLKGPLSNIYFFNNKDQTWMYFNKESGLINFFYIDKQILPDKTTISKHVQLYIGPDGISETPNETVGKFISPIIDFSWFYRMHWQLNSLIVYDKILRRFFNINLINRTMIKGPEFLKNSSRKPIQIGHLRKMPPSLYISFSPPQTIWPGLEDDTLRPRSRLRPIIETDKIQDAGPYLLVLDESGRIDLLDKETLEFVKGISPISEQYMRLPAPETYFGTMRHVTPKHLLGYEVYPLTLNKYYTQDSNTPTFIQPLPDSGQTSWRTDREYFGMFVASVSDDGTSMAFAVFDNTGQQKTLQHTRLTEYDGGSRHYTPSSKVAYWGTPWAPLSSICKYVTENVHPLILSFASICMAPSFEAGAGHRSLFLLPNSFIAMNARNGRGNIVERFLSSLWIMVPSIILSIWLVVRVKKDAVVTGLSENARFYWMLGTLAFGLAAFVTFKITKPKITLVTCSNCGQPRRPDMEKCHRCKSGWHVPELTPPNWRVLGIVIETPNGEN